jgi:hypothetical protein
MAKQENVTKYNINYADADGNKSVIDYISEDKYNELLKKAAAENGSVEVTKQQTFTITEAESLEELSQLFPLRALEFGNYGARLAQQNYMRQECMINDEFTGVEGAVDLAPEVQEPKERKKASPRDKAISILAKLAKESGVEMSRDQIETMLAQFQPAGASA